MQETRERERVEVETAIYVLWGVDESLRGGKITSISIKGCFIQTKTEAVAGQAISIHVRLPTERWLILTGDVIHVLRRVGFGVQFKELAEDERGMLELLVEYYSHDPAIVASVVCEDEQPRRDVLRIKGRKVQTTPAP